MNILITGITSFLGRAIAKELIREHKVYGLIRPESASKLNKSEFSKVNILSYDIADINSVLIDYPNLRIDICIHLAWAGIGKTGRMDNSIQKENIKNTLALIKLCKEIGVNKFLFAGSQAEYGFTLEKLNKSKNNTDIVIEEDFPTEPISEYGKAKLEVLKRGYVLCKRLGMEYIHMRIFSVYGYGDHDTSLIMSCIKYFDGLKKKGLEKDLELSSCKQLWNYIYIDDCAKAISSLAVKKLNIETMQDCIVNIASDDTRHLRDFALEIAKEFGFPEKIKFVEKEASEEGTPYLNPGINRLKSYTGFEPKFSFIEGIRKIEDMYSM